MVLHAQTPLLQSPGVDETTRKRGVQLISTTAAASLAAVLTELAVADVGCGVVGRVPAEPALSDTVSVK